MTLAITSTLLSGADPRPVQVNVTGLTVAAAFTVTGSCAGWSWTVQGAAGVVADSTQAVLVDVKAPLNAAITYTVEQGAASASTSSTVTVPFTDGDAAIVSLDGTQLAVIAWLDNEDPREGAPRQEFYTPAGRSAPVMHYDVEAAETGTLVAETVGAHTATLLAMLKAGAPVIVRTDVGVRDLDPVMVVGVTAYPRRLVGATGTRRRWDLAFTIVDDTTDETTLVLATLADVNTKWSGLTLDDVNTLWSAGYLSDLNAYDWQA